MENEGCIQGQDEGQNYVKIKNPAGGVYKINIPYKSEGDKLCVLTVYNTADLKNVAGKER